MPSFQTELNELKTIEDHQRLIEAINTLLCMDDEVEAALVTSAHQKLDQAVGKVNGRLKTCDDLLQKGLRAEALQESQLEPKLLDVVAVLDFDEMELWNDYAQQCGFAPVPELLVDVADDLQTAWADEEPLTDLRYRHRLHALARSPLPIRIDVLRQLAKVDESNPLWEESLVEYEQARLTQVGEECKTAAKSEDLESLIALKSELKNGGWRVSLPKKLLGFVESKSQEIQGKHARAQLMELEPRLNEAYSLSDVETARQLRAEWGKQSAVARLSERDPLMVKVSEPLKWLSEKDRQDRERAAFEAAVSELERALDRPDATKADLEPLYYKVEQFDRGVPESLQERLTVRVAELDQAEASRQRNKILIAGASAALILVLIAVGIFLSLRSAELSGHLANVQGLIENEQLDQAETYVAEREKDNPRVFEHPDFQALIRDLEKAVQADEDRRTELARHLAQAGKTRDALSTEDPASLDRSHVNRGYDALTKANRIAKTELEKNDVLNRKEELDAKVLKVQAAVDESYRAEVQKFEEKIKQLDPNAHGYSEYSRQLAMHKRAANTLRSRKWIRDGLGPQLVDPLLAEIDAKMKDARLAAAEAKHLAEIKEAIGDAKEYRSELSDYVNDDDFRGSARQRDFQQVLNNEAALWEGFEAWSRLISDLDGADLVSDNPTFARSMLEEVQEFLKDHKGFPQEDELQAIAKHLQFVVNRNEAGLLSGLEKNVINQTIVRGLYMLETADGKYYSTQLPVGLGNTRYMFRYALDSTLGDVETVTVKKNEVKNPRLAGGAHDFASPQMKFSKLAKQKIDNLAKNESTWESDFLDILKALHEDEKMDEFLKFLLTSSIETTACRGSLYLSQEFEKNLEILKEASGNVDPDANWINPEVAGGDKIRQNAADVLRKLTPPSQVEKGLKTFLAKYKKVSVGPGYDWVGWLHRNRVDEWDVTFANDQSSDAKPVKLYVLTQNGSTGEVTFTEIGEDQFRQEEVTAPDGSPALVQGRPVFKMKK